MRLAFALATVVALIAVVSFAVADENARVLIVASSPKDSTATRLRDELSVLGFDVVVVEANASTTNLADAARAAGASAAAQVEVWPPEIILWVTDGDHSTDDTLRVSQSLSGKVEAEMLALRAVELLRGRLLPVPPAAEPASAPALSVELPVSSASAPPIASSVPMPVPTIPTIKPVKHKKRKPLFVRSERPSAFLGPAMLFSPGGLSLSAHVALAGRLPLVNRFSAEAWLFLPVVPGLVGNKDGEIAQRVFSLGTGIDARLTDWENPFVLTMGAGAGPMLLYFDGESTGSANLAASGTRMVGFAYGRVGLGVRLNPKVRLRVDSLVGPVFPEPVLRILGREVASFGRPAAFLTLGAEMTP